MALFVPDLSAAPGPTRGSRRVPPPPTDRPAAGSSGSV